MQRTPGEIMSKMCGDTARFNRIRKRKIAWRAMVRELKLKLNPAPLPAEAPPVKPV
jgi:hypothetical protein